MLDHSRERTWLPVSTLLITDPVCVFQILIHRSAVPPPVANVLRSKGHHARAFTAARCSVSVKRGAAVEYLPWPTEASHRQHELSLLPDASMLLSLIHI